MSRNIKLPLIIEDFEEGDRIYRQSRMPDIIMFGTVTSITPDELNVTFDNGYEHAVNLDFFHDDPDAAFYYGKCLRMDQIWAGSVISVRTLGETLTATVEFISEERIVFTYLEEPDVTETWVAKEGQSLEFLLRNWELEG